MCIPQHLYTKCIYPLRTMTIGTRKKNQPASCVQCYTESFRTLLPTHLHTHTHCTYTQVSVEAENLLGGFRRATNTAYFTYVSLGSDHRLKRMPQLKMVNDEEKARFEEGRKRYEVRRKESMEKLQKLQEMEK